MDAAGALKAARKAITEGRVAFTYHASVEVMIERGITRADIVHALEHADDAEHISGAKWKAFGPITDGTEYAVVFILRAELLIVTAHLPP